LLHHSTTLNIRGESYQLKERKKARAAARGSRAAQARQSRSGLPGGENRLLGDPRRGVFSPGRYLATPEEEVKEASELYVGGEFSTGDLRRFQPALTGKIEETVPLGHFLGGA